MIRGNYVNYDLWLELRYIRKIIKHNYKLKVSMVNGIYLFECSTYFELLHSISKINVNKLCTNSRIII